MGLMLGGWGPVVLTGQTDASWVEDLATQQSSQGYTFSLGHDSLVLGAQTGAQNEAHLRCFLAQELQQRGQLRLAYVATRANTADIFSKASQPGDHQRFSSLDKKNNFLQSKLDRMLYMDHLAYYNDGTCWICKLLKSLYRQKQSPLLWYLVLDAVLTGAGWSKIQVNKALYFRVGDKGVACWVLVYPTRCQQQHRDAEGAAGDCPLAAGDQPGQEVFGARDCAQPSSAEAVAAPVVLRRQAA
ncbi:unnamed protein product [Closterium sp. NIES-54]